MRLSLLFSECSSAPSRFTQKSVRPAFRSVRQLRLQIRLADRTRWKKHSEAHRLETEPVLSFQRQPSGCATGSCWYCRAECRNCTRKDPPWLYVAAESLPARPSEARARNHRQDQRQQHENRQRVCYEHWILLDSVAVTMPLWARVSRGNSSRREAAGEACSQHTRCCRPHVRHWY